MLKSIGNIVHSKENRMGPSARYKFVTYNIVGDMDDSDTEYKLDLNLQNKMQMIYAFVMMDPRKGEKQVLELIENHPDIPQFKNTLTSVYAQTGRIDLARKLNDEIIRKHPGYVFGLVNKAHEHMDNGEFDMVPGLLGPFMEIGKLYPGRTAFHVQEVLVFNQAAALYYHGIGNLEQARKRLEMMEKIDPNARETIQTRSILG
jgi:tetratricopeptide (TPR) repeat protein